MKIKHIASALIAGALVVPALTFAADDGMTKTDKAKTEMKDSWITTKIKAEYVKDKTVSATKIKVITEDHGVVTLGGKAKSQAEVDRAVTIAKGVKGVTDVTSNIEISAS
ncbi:MAG TPA: BON domain-containing protein [Burkholderiales bacterium]|jgi:osmotically-inducible protein OsmY|nr:BON domain-containing protein [Burkholderiales bacterium]